MLLRWHFQEWWTVWAHDSWDSLHFPRDVKAEREKKSVCESMRYINILLFYIFLHGWDAPGDALLPTTFNRINIYCYSYIFLQKDQVESEWLQTKAPHFSLVILKSGEYRSCNAWVPAVIAYLVIAEKNQENQRAKTPACNPKIL